MNNYEWQQIGADIKKQVQDAIDANDFSRLSKTIGDTVSQAIDGVGKNINDVVNNVRDEIIPPVQNGPDHKVIVPQGEYIDPYRGHNHPDKYSDPRYMKPNLRPDKRYFVRTPQGSISGIICMVLGYSIFGVFGFFFSVMALLALTEPVPLAALGIFGMLTAAGLGCGLKGSGLRGRASRFKRYVSAVQNKLYCSIEDLCSKTGKSRKFVIKDLRRMMQNGWFLQGHLDREESCFIVSDQIYEQYQLTQKNFEEQQKLQITQKQDAETEVKKNNDKSIETEYGKMLEEGHAYIQMIRLCNDEIPGEEMSEKLDKLELLVTRIFAQVEKEPELAPDLHKMLNYYLPTTQKLLEAYRDLDRQNLNLGNISTTKKEIEATIDTINQAFEKFLDELFREKAWDIQTDISVLHTMLKQDGYLNGDFKK